LAVAALTEDVFRQRLLREEAVATLSQAIPYPVAALCRHDPRDIARAELIANDTRAFAFARDFDFSQLIAIFVTAPATADGLGWTGEKAAEVERKYKMWFFLRRLFPTEVLPPTATIGLFWKLHLQDSVSYVLFCDAIRGGYIHYSPYQGFFVKM
jgi:hypothetical protein